MWDTIGRLVVLLAIRLSAAHAGPGHNFTRLVDHVDDNFSPRTLTCASINASGDVAFKGTWSAPMGSAQGRDRPREPGGRDHHHR
jgi:hypothetical protein